MHLHTCPLFVMHLLSCAPLFLVLLFLACASGSDHLHTPQVGSPRPTTEHQDGVRSLREGTPKPLGLPEAAWGPGRDQVLGKNTQAHVERPLLSGQESGKSDRPGCRKTGTCSVKGVRLGTGNQHNKLRKALPQLHFDLSSCRGIHRRVKSAMLSLAFRRDFNSSCSFSSRFGSRGALKPSTSGGNVSSRFTKTSNVGKEQMAAVCRVKYDILRAARRCLTHPRGPCVLGLELPREVAEDGGVWGEAVIDGRLTTPRARRQAKSDDCAAQQPHCCRRTMRVSFRDIGWSDWIMAPSEYNAYYCEGSCPPKQRMATAHAAIKVMMQHVTRGDIPQSCCVPAAYRPLTVLQIDSSGQLVISVLDNMIVSKCKCS
ncbi:hypothetical protein AAFF_G00065900 [Aldrovandia affinis]|uniref:TGF-beta family profile domain-containing protein n=1 Tax=Aldrovandia affinis TaxID=143900 RepID=A0AAD7T578_9TELE|nr:hypothetical protein AAFF_G00065900 [Aldrovandia affinis]